MTHTVDRTNLFDELIQVQTEIEPIPLVKSFLKPPCLYSIAFQLAPINSRGVKRATDRCLAHRHFLSGRTDAEATQQRELRRRVANDQQLHDAQVGVVS